MSGLSAFKQSFKGDIVTPEDDGYSEAIARSSRKTSHANLARLVLIITRLVLCPLFLVLDNLAIVIHNAHR
jgi:hypothetical protein